jgi:hypothetical protein
MIVDSVSVPSLQPLVETRGYECLGPSLALGTEDNRGS